MKEQFLVKWKKFKLYLNKGNAKISSFVEKVLLYKHRDGRVLVENPHEYKFIPQLKGFVRAFPIVSLFVLTVLGIISNKIGLSELVEKIAVSWRFYTRMLWTELFDFLQFPIKISNYEYDILTLALTAILSIVTPLIINKIKIPRLKVYQLESIWMRLNASKDKSGLKKLLFQSIPFLTIGILFFGFAILNLNDKITRPEAKRLLVTELGIVIIVIAFHLVKGIIKIIIKKKTAIFKSTGISILIVLIVYSWFIAFLPIEFWSYPSNAKYFSLFLIFTSTILFMIAFIRNWRFFGFTVFYILAIIVMDRMFSLL